MGDRKHRRTITGTHFVENHPVRQSTVAAPTNEIPPGRAYIQRMGWNFNPGVRVATTAKRIVATVRDTAPADKVFFLDSSFIRGPLHEEVWQALLTRQVATTPWVDQELGDWMASPGHNVAHAAVVRQRLSNGRIIRVQPDDDYLRHGYKYYSALLLLRKLKGKQFALAFQRQHGRLPTPVDFFPAFKKMGRGYDDRAARMAWKGACDYDKKNYAADEQLVTMAVLHSLMTGRETTILTRDHDLMDQFYKLIFLIDTHYRSMLFANKYVSTPEDYRLQNRRTICEGHPELLDDRFKGDDDLVMRPHLPPDTLWNSLLPEVSPWVNAGCVWFGDGPETLQVSQMVFCADVEIVKLLRIKAETDGLNTNLLDGKNCHIWPCPDLQELLGSCVAVATDKRVDYHTGLPPYRAVDMLHAVRSDEQFERFEVKGVNEYFPFGRRREAIAPNSGETQGDGSS